MDETSALPSILPQPFGLGEWIQISRRAAETLQLAAKRHDAKKS
jgi:hypothetical protein